MIQLLRDKKVIFFDVGYTLDKPASGDWMFTNRFLKEAGDRLKTSSEAETRKAMEDGLQYLMEDHLVTTVEAEISQFYRFYSIISDALDLDLSENQREEIARDRALNKENYLPYPGIHEVLETLSKTHRLGVISDTWPSIDKQMDYLGISKSSPFRRTAVIWAYSSPTAECIWTRWRKAAFPRQRPSSSTTVPAIWTARRLWASHRS